MKQKMTRVKYSPTTGVMYGIKGPALTVDRRGYRRICYNGENWTVHRLAWRLVYGEIPEGMQVDHINRNKLDNRLVNLRLVTRQENRANTEKQQNNTSGWKGVSWSDRYKKWYSQITYQGVKRHIGYATNLYEAIAAYNIYALSLHDPCLFINHLPKINTEEYIKLVKTEVLLESK